MKITTTAIFISLCLLLSGCGMAKKIPRNHAELKYDYAMTESPAPSDFSFVWTSIYNDNTLGELHGSLANDASDYVGIGVIGFIDENKKFTTAPWLMKLRYDGVKEYDYAVTTISNDAILTGIAQMSDGNYMAVGQTKCPGIASGKCIATFLTKFQPNGAVEWKNIMSRSTIYRSFGSITCRGTSCYIPSLKAKSGSSRRALYIIEADTTGKITEHKITDLEKAYYMEIISTSDNGFILTGIENISETPAAPMTSWMIKVSSEWKPLWHTTLKSPGNTRIVSSSPTHDGGAYAVLVNRDDNALDTIWFARISPDGKLLWQRALNYEVSDGDKPFEAITLDDGSMFVAGKLVVPPSGSENQQDFFAYHFDPDGNIAWHNSACLFPDISKQKSITVDYAPNKDILIAGYGNDEQYDCPENANCSVSFVIKMVRR